MFTGLEIYLMVFLKSFMTEKVDGYTFADDGGRQSYQHREGSVLRNVLSVIDSLHCV